MLTPALVKRAVKRTDGPYPVSEASTKPSITKQGVLHPKDVPVTRWFLLHSFANLMVCVTAVKSMRAVLSDPIHAMDGTKYDDTSLFGTASVWPLTIINSIHVYHMFGGFKLNSAEYA